MLVSIILILLAVSFLLAIVSLIQLQRKSHILKEAKKNLAKGRVVFHQV